MAHGPSETGRSYVGLFCLLVVIAGLIALLAMANVAPLATGGHAPASGGHHEGAPLQDGADGAGDPHAALGEEAAEQAAGGPVASAPAVKLPKPPPLPDPGQALTRIAFGSCLGQYQPAPILNVIAARVPQLFIWMGDNVYADGRDETGALVDGPDYIEAAYRTLEALPEYQELYASVPFLATWDDHDYGRNDAGAELTYKHHSKGLFLKHVGHNAHPGVNTHAGVYDAFIFGPEGRRTQIILLDTRTFRSEWMPTDERDAPGKERYIPDSDPKKTMLGETQWLWLGEQLRKPADVRFIVSSIQVIADGHGWERWGLFPLERERLYGLIKKSKARGVIFLSGDRHAGALYVNEKAADYPLTEITSSSLNLPLSGWGVDTPKPETDGYKLDQLYIDENFGVAEIDWEARAVFLELRGSHSELLQSVAVRLDG